MSEELNSTELAEAILKSRSTANSTSLPDVLNSVFKDAIETKREGNIVVTKKIKVKHRAVRDSNIEVRGLFIYFDQYGVGEINEYDKEVIEIEQTYRPGIFTFIEEEIKEDITVEQFLEKARLDIEESSEENDESSEEEEEIKISKRGRKGKGK